MRFDPTTAAIRFGTGLSPFIAPPSGVDAMLGLLRGPDVMAGAFEIARFNTLLPDFERIKSLTVQRRQAKDAADREALVKKLRASTKAARLGALTDLAATVSRGVVTQDGLRERLTYFWADHFTAKGKNGPLRFAASSYVEEAIRPHITGRFADLLRAAVMHPFMLQFLDQSRSTGPKSVVGLKTGRGLNENLAREVLELHTLGVGGAYGQTDVRELAELFAGLSYTTGKGFVYRPAIAEPGAEIVLGKAYGGAKPALDDVLGFLEAVAIHPDTGRHIARKLVVHFVSDQPDADLVDDVAAAYLTSGGALMQTYAALLNHPLAWAVPMKKARQPFDFIVASFRALGLDAAAMRRLKAKDAGRLIHVPMRVMGQDWQNPVGPDGWDEAAEAWINPQGIAARIDWAMTAPQQMLRVEPDPRAVLESAVGDRAGPALRFAVGAADTKWAGVGLVLVSPEFQRR